MKKAILALALCAAAISCNMRNTIYDCESFGNIDSPSAIMEDGGYLQYPSDPSTISELAVGTRIHYFYNMTKDDSTHVTLNGGEVIKVKEVIAESSIVTDTLGDRSIQIARFALYSGGYMNVHFAFSYIPYSSCVEIVNMTMDDVKDHGDTLVYTLRHKRYIPEADKGKYETLKETSANFTYGIMSFPINKHVEAAKAAGKERVPVRINNTDPDGNVYAIKGTIPTDTYIQKPIRIK